MIYELVHAESAPRAVRLIARYQIEQSIGELDSAGEAGEAGEVGADADERVHSVRKRMKKLRGLLHLVEPVLGQKLARREDVTFRDAGRRLAGARRGAAVLANFDALVARFPEDLSSQAGAALRARLSLERERAVSAVHAERHAGEVIETMKQALGRVEHWPLEELDARALSKGVERVYTRARRRMKQALRTSATEDLHQWRKWAKYHWYHVRLLRPTWPAALDPLASDLEQLTEELGLEHDLDDLRQLLIEHMPPESLEADLSRLLALIERRREELRSSAFRRGTRLFADRPPALARRFRAYYDAWRATPAPQEEVAHSTS